MARANDVADLLLRIDATTEGLRRELKKAEGSVDKSGSKMQSMMKKLDKRFQDFQKIAGRAMKAAGVAFASAATALAGLTAAGLKSVDSLAKVSQRLGIATENLAALRFAANQTGVSTETLDMALQRMTRRVAEAAQGSGEAVKALKELGLSAEELNKLAPDQMFRRVTEAMQGVGRQSDRVRLAMKLFDSEGVSLVQTMQGGTRALDDFAYQAEQAGIAINQIDAAKVEAANDAINRVKTLITGFTQQLAVRFAPVLEAIAERIFRVGTESEGMAETATGAFNSVIEATGFVANAVHGVGVTFRVVGRAATVSLLFIERGVLELADQIINAPVRAMNVLIDTFNTLPGVMDIDRVGFEQFGQQIIDRGELIDEAITQAFEDINDVLNEPLPSDTIDRFVADATRTFREFGGILGETEVTFRNLDGSLGPVQLAMRRFRDNTGEASDEVQGLIDSLNNEIAALGMTSREQAIFNAELKALSMDAGPEAIATIRELAGQSYDLKKAQQEAGKAAEDAARQAELNWQRTHEFFVESFLDGFDNIGDAFEKLTKRMLAEWASSGLMNLLGMSGGGGQGTATSTVSSFINSIGGGGGSGGGSLQLSSLITKGTSLLSGGGGGVGVANAFQQVSGGVNPMTLAQAGSGNTLMSFASKAVPWAAAAYAAYQIIDGLTSDPDGYKRSLGGFAAAPTAGFMGRTDTFDMDAFASGFDPMGVALRGSREDAINATQPFRQADQALVELISELGGNLNTSGSTFSGVSQDGQFGTAGTFLGMGGKTTEQDLAQMVDRFTLEVAGMATGLDEALMDTIRSASTAEEVFTALGEAIKKASEPVDEAANDADMHRSAAQKVIDAATLFTGGTNDIAMRQARRTARILEQRGELDRGVLADMSGYSRSDIDSALDTTAFDGYRAQAARQANSRDSTDQEIRSLRSETKEMASILAQLLSSIAVNSEDQKEILERLEVVGLKTRAA